MTSEAPVNPKVVAMAAVPPPTLLSSEVSEQQQVALPPTAKGPSQAGNGHYSAAPPQPPPPNNLPKFSQASPDLNRPDSAYGGSGGTPSLSSAESVESVDTLRYDVAPPPNPLLATQPHPNQHFQLDQSFPPQDQLLHAPSLLQPFPQKSEVQTTQQNQPHPQSDLLPQAQRFQQQLQSFSSQDNQTQAQPAAPNGENGEAAAPPAPDESYADSAYDDASSINESITDTLDSAYSRYRYENGRRYHIYCDGAYWGPNDEEHNDQQDIAHHAWRLALDHQLYKAPVKNPDRILDVGTGTGIWAIEMAEEFPAAQVVGTDLSPIQPTWVPPNCVFEVDNVTAEWTFRKNSFDFIHSREMFGSIADWDEYFRQCYVHLKPGGWVEALERGVKPTSDDGTVGPDHFWTTWGDTVLSVGETWGKGFDAWELLKERMERAGFVDVVQVPMKWPIGPWMEDKHMKELGRWNALRLDTGLEGYVMRLFTMAGGWTYTEVQAFLGKFKACMRDPNNHGYLPGNCVYGRKPLDAPWNHD
ncbi:MAG: hypothetical protein Q9219_003503 [cf. Caloplaca sp. 3 TL-2023]